MTAFVLDTNAWIAAFRFRDPSMIARLDAAIAGRETLVLPSIVWSEIVYGIAGTSRPVETGLAWSRFFDGMHPCLERLAFDHDAATIAGRLRQTLRQRGTPIGPYDVLIAAHALALGATLVTANVREFARVDGLAIVNWAA